MRRRVTNWGWLARTLFKAGVFFGVGVLLIATLGLAQRLGWIGGAAGDGASASGSHAHAHPQEYTCAMHPQIRQSEPGRCPICGMKLVPATDADSGSALDEFAVYIEPAARRVAGIETATARRMQLERTIRSVGEIAFDESRLATITAWVGGRIERLFADYTGVKVRKGDHLVHLYSPDLYAAQVEYLIALGSAARVDNSRLASVGETNRRLLDDAREKLLELGMTEQQIGELEKTRKAQTRLRIYAPIGGTVIEKAKVEGEYVQTGDVIYRIADLSTVWLMLELFPDDASQIRYGQKVEARVQSLPGEVFTGRVSFVDPTVDKRTRTVGVRVDIDNRHGRLRPGDYASATIRVPITNGGEVYDAELAGKWISPRHPQIIRDQPGKCPLCGIDLVPTSQLGFADQPVEKHWATVIPRDAVLMAGSASVVYVETEPGRFEIRPVSLGPMVEQTVKGPSGQDEAQVMAVILSGVEPGEKVATSGNFLIDSQMQLAGKPSLIDPTRAVIRQKQLKPLELEYDRPRSMAGETGRLLDELYAAYFDIQKRLAADALPDAAVVGRLVSVAGKLQDASDLPEPVRQELVAVLRSVGALNRDELALFRREFRQISHAVIRLAAQVRGPQSAVTFIHFFCPMVEEGGGDWLQPGEPLANPYFGSEMLQCGELAHRLAMTGSEDEPGMRSADRTDAGEPAAETPVPIPVPLPVPVPVQPDQR